MVGWYRPQNLSAPRAVIKLHLKSTCSAQNGTYSSPPQGDFSWEAVDSGWSEKLLFEGKEKSTLDLARAFQVLCFFLKRISGEDNQQSKNLYYLEVLRIGEGERMRELCSRKSAGLSKSRQSQVPELSMKVLKRCALDNTCVWKSCACIGSTLVPHSSFVLTKSTFIEFLSACPLMSVESFAQVRVLLLGLFSGGS